LTDAIARSIVREIEPLDADARVGVAAKRVEASGLPALPAVERDGTFAGIFGEREFLRALFPAYVGQLGSSAMIKRSIDDTIERRLTCVDETIRAYLTTDHVAVEDDYSDTQLAEIFLHHRVLVIPVARDGRVVGLVTRSDFFGELLKRLDDAG
jgi:CBS domain-containing protein